MSELVKFTELSDAMKRYYFSRFDPRPGLLRGVSFLALRVAGALNGRNNVTIIDMQGRREAWWYEPSPRIQYYQKRPGGYTMTGGIVYEHKLEQGLLIIDEAHVYEAD